jgi:hypothetical protein
MLSRPNQPPRIGGMRRLADVVGCDQDGAPKRPVRPDDYRPEGLPFTERNRWLRKVRGLVAECRNNGERGIPHKIEAVARAIAELGDVCKASREYIADKAACVVGTVENAIAWLESKGALTWSHTTGKDKSGRIVRKANLYTLLRNFGGATAIIARTMRALWRERPKVVTVSKPNECPGIQNLPLYIDRHEAQRRLTEVAQHRQTVLRDLWQARHAI